MAWSGVNLTFIMELKVFTYWKFILLLNFEQFEKHLKVSCVLFLDCGLQM
jgi:hypothetical protein